MKTFKELYTELKEHELQTPTNVKAVRHYNDHELAAFLKRPENKGHRFIGKDKYGKPMTADLSSIEK